MEGFTEPPTKVWINVVAKVLKVLDHEDELLVQLIRSHQYRGPNSVRIVAVLPGSRQVRVRRLQFLGQIGISGCTLVGEIEQHLEPEVSYARDFVTFLHEANGHQVLGVGGVSAQLGGHPRQKHGLSSATRRHHKEVLASRCPDVFAQDLQHRLELVLSHDELTDQFFVGLKHARIELPDHGVGRRFHL